MSDDITIKVDHVSKEFKLPHEKNTSIKGTLINLAHTGKRNRSFERQQVLNDVSFEIKKGDFFGIVGRNGSGKSTMLKMLAGIYTPTKGRIQVNGKLTPFIELGVGFNPELTGRENVFLNGALLGFNRKEMEAMYEDIVEFAELKKFMDQKLKNYSSGMQVRLAFSIAIRAQTDILLIDEVLAVGDAAFQQKCYEIFSDLKRQGKTIILVTHDMSAVTKFCNRAILIQDGIIVDSGQPKDIADHYLEINYEAADQKTSGVENAKLSLNKTRLIRSNGSGSTINPSESCKIELSFTNDSKQPLHFGLQIFNEAGTYCFGTNTSLSKSDTTTLSKGLIDLSIEAALVPGTYSVTAAVLNEDATRVLVYKPKAATFRVAKTNEVEGVANLNYSWGEARV